MGAKEAIDNAVLKGRLEELNIKLENSDSWVLGMVRKINADIQQNKDILDHYKGFVDSRFAHLYNCIDSLVKSSGSIKEEDLCTICDGAGRLEETYTCPKCDGNGINNN